MILAFGSATAAVAQDVRVVSCGGVLWGVPGITPSENGGYDVDIRSDGGQICVESLVPNLRLNRVHIYPRNLNLGNMVSVTIRGAGEIPSASVGFVGEVMHRPDPFFPNGTSAIELIQILGTMLDENGFTVDGRLGDGTGAGLGSLNSVQVYDIKQIDVLGDVRAGIASFGISNLANTGQIDFLRSRNGGIYGAIGAADIIQNIVAFASIGPTSGTVISIATNKSIGTISAPSINANITAGNNSLVSDPGNISSLSADTIRGNIVCNTMSGGVGPSIQCTAPLAASLIIRNTLSKSITTPAIGSVYIGGGQTGGTIALGANGLTGVIFMGGTWSGAVTVGGTTLAPKPAYTQASSTLGGGRVAVVPFNHYEADSGPTSLAQGLFNQGGSLPNNGVAPGLELAFYGNVFTPGTTDLNGNCIPQGMPFEVELVSPSNTVTVINSMVDVFLDCSDQPTLSGRFVQIKGKASRPLYPTPPGWQYRVNIGSSGLYSLVGGTTLVPVVPKIINFTLIEDCDKDGIADAEEDPPQFCETRWGGCAADFNMDVFIDFFDYDDFLAAYEGGDPSADFNGDNFIDFFDYDAFTAAFELGCGWDD